MSKVAILTNFMEFQPGYSLTGIVKDQAQMLARYGNEVHLFVNSKYHGEDFDPSVILQKKIPFTHLIDYTSKADLTPEHKMIVNQTAGILVEELKDMDFVFTHDFVFTGWFMPYGLACAKASQDLPNVRWFHWIHSVPTAMKDWWNIRDYGTHHKLIYPNKTDLIRVAEAYRGQLHDCRCIPHIKDLRTWFDFDKETCEFIDEYPAVMQAEIVQIYPASVDRLSAKRVKEVMLIFSRLKDLGHSVCLVVANQWATGRKQKEDTEQYKKIASRNGLKVGEEVVFTSDWKDGKYGVGIPKRILRELFQCSNLFIFPTREESFGLVLPEAALAGGVLCVLNKSLPMQMEISGFTTLYFDFGSFSQDLNITNEGQYFRDLAFIIAGRMSQNESVLTKTYMRRMYNMDNLYAKFYSPLCAESRLW